MTDDDYASLCERLDFEARCRGAELDFYGIGAEAVAETTLAHQAAAAIRELRAEVERLRGAISWALGEGDSDFGDNVPEGAGRYWWRKELRRRAALAGEKP